MKNEEKASSRSSVVISGDSQSDAVQSLPMSRADYLLSHLAKECSEVAIRCTKAQMFGLNEIQPGQELTNRERILYEFADILAIADVMREVGILPDMNALSPEVEARVREKKVKAASFRNYSRDLGRLTATQPEDDFKTRNVESLGLASSQIDSSSLQSEVEIKERLEAGE